MSGGRKWKVRDHLSCLGYTIGATGNSSACRKKFLQQLQDCFWANSRVLLNRLAPISHRAKHWKKISRGIGKYRYGLWPFLKTSAARIDAANCKLIGFICGSRPATGESIEEFCRRKRREAKSATINARAMLSDLWALKTMTWLEHLQRHPSCPASMLIQEQTPDWLETCRILSGRSLVYQSDFGGQTMTRSGRGQPIRYLGKWWQQIKVDNPDKDVRVSRRRAQELKACIMHRP